MSMELLVLNKNLESVYIADSFKSFLWVDRYDECGDFEFRSLLSPDILANMQKGFYLWVNDSEHQMIIENILVESDAEDGATLTITGRSLEALLKRRIVWGQKELNGNLQTELRTLFEESISSPAIADRLIPNFIFKESTDSRITALTVNEQFTGDELYDVFTKLCQANGLGFKVVLDSSNQFVCSLYLGEDRSYAQSANPFVVFSPSFDNLSNSNYYSSDANMKNIALVAGEGEGVSRRTRVVGTATGLERREIFMDASSVSSNADGGILSEAEYDSLLDSKGDEALSGHKEETAFDGEVEATQMFKYGEDFFIGDVVQIADDYGHEAAACISELIISQSEEGITKCPTFKKILEGGADE